MVFTSDGVRLEVASKVVRALKSKIEVVSGVISEAVYYSYKAERPKVLSAGRSSACAVG